MGLFVCWGNVVEAGVGVVLVRGGSMTAMIRAGGYSKTAFYGKAVCYCAHANKATTDSSTG